MSHIPVLLHEVVTILDPHPGEFIVDGTLGGGGHAQALIERLRGRGTFLGIEGNERSLTATASRLNDLLRTLGSHVRFIAAHANFGDLPTLLQRYRLPNPDVVLLDLGFSSLELGTVSGLSFLRDEPLDMRYGVFAGDRSAADLVNREPKEMLARLIATFGEERYAARIAEAIVRQRRARPFRTSGELVEAIMSAVPRGYERGRIHPATRTFQALRIAVNREIENLESFLGFLPSVAAPGARAAVISFHSLEDKLVKRLFRILAAHGAATALTKKPLVPQETEVRENPRSRSAKLRAVKFLTTSH